MNKVILFFYNIKDLVAFEKFYLEQIFPIVHVKPGIICTHVTTISQNEDNSTGIQLILETLYKSEADMYRDLTSSKSQEQMKMMTGSSLADFYFYIAKEQRFDFVNEVTTQA